MALTRSPRQARRPKGAGSPSTAGSPSPAGSPSVPATTTGREVVQPIVVPNTLWQSTNPLAYDGGRPSEITHLADVERSGTAARDNAR